MGAMSSEPVGLVIGTEDAYALDFWVWVYPHRYLQLDDVVTVPLTLPALVCPAQGISPARRKVRIRDRRAENMFPLLGLPSGQGSAARRVVYVQTGGK